MGAARLLLLLTLGIFASVLWLARPEFVDTEEDASGKVCTPTLSGNGETVNTGRKEMTEAFVKIYNESFWGKEGGGSGDGSSLNATAGIRMYLEKLILKEKIKSFADIPCGSAHWIPPLLQAVRRKRPCFEYRGIDIVAHIIEASQKRFEGDPLTSFAVGDVTVTPIPKAELILSRDAIQHLPIRDGIKLLENVRAANPRFFLVGSYLGKENVNVPTGGYYDVNLVAAPFSLPQPFDIFQETPDPGGKHPQKWLLLYTRAQVQGFDTKRMRVDMETKMINGRFPGGMSEANLPNVALDVADKASAYMKTST